MDDIAIGVRAVRPRIEMFEKAEKRVPVRTQYVGTLPIKLHVIHCNFCLSEEKMLQLAANDRLS